MAGNVRLDYHDRIAVITNDNVEKHNAFDDEMDRQLFEILGELKGRRDVRADDTQPAVNALLAKVPNVRVCSPTRELALKQVTAVEFWLKSIYRSRQ